MDPDDAHPLNSFRVHSHNGSTRRPRCAASEHVVLPRSLTGECDPARHRAVWPSTGSCCRGGVAISRVMGCRGVAELPEGMSAERFQWLERRVSEPAAFVSASRSAGTLGAGDALKEEWSTRIVAAEALECPTLLRNGFGEHVLGARTDHLLELGHEDRLRVFDLGHYT